MQRRSARILRVVVRTVATGAAVVLLTAIAVAAYFVETRFLRHQPAVHRIVERIPPAERHFAAARTARPDKDAAGFGPDTFRFCLPAGPGGAGHRTDGRVASAQRSIGLAITAAAR